MKSPQRSWRQAVHQSAKRALWHERSEPKGWSAGARHKSAYPDQFRYGKILRPGGPNQFFNSLRFKRRAPNISFYSGRMTSKRIFSKICGMSILDLFRKKPELGVPDPKFKDGTRVRVVHVERNSPYEAIITKSIWHHRLASYHYYLEGKSKRYLEADLESV